MRGVAFGVAVLALVCAPAGGAAFAQTAAKPSKTEIQSAGRDLDVLAAALESDKVPAPVKNALFLCLYQNTLAKVSATTSKVLAANKLDRTDPSKLLGVMAGVCGYRPGAAPATKAR